MTLFQRVCGWLLGEPSLKQQQIDREIATCLREIEAKHDAQRKAQLDEKARAGLDAIMTRGK